MYRISYLLIALVFLAIPAHAAFPFIGEWENTDPHTGGFVGFAIAMKGHVATIAMRGACSPKPCEMAPEQLFLYASAVDKASDIRAAGAQLHTFFSESFVVLTPQADGRLRADVYERFTDGSGRPPFTHTEFFKRR